MHRCLSRMGSSDQTMSSNGVVQKCSTKKVVSLSHATLLKSVKYCSVAGVGVWQSHKLWCSGEESSALKGLSSSELVNTNQQHVRL